MKSVANNHNANVRSLFIALKKHGLQLLAKNTWRGLDGTNHNFFYFGKSTDRIRTHGSFVYKAGQGLCQPVMGRHYKLPENRANLFTSAWLEAGFNPEALIADGGYVVQLPASNLGVPVSRQEQAAPQRIKPKRGQTSQSNGVFVMCS